MRTKHTALRWSRGWAAIAAGLLLSLTLCRAIAAADLQVRVTQSNGKPLAGAVVTVHALGAAPPSAAPVQAVMDQLDLAFTPDVLVIPVGSTVSFPNTDKTGHEVYSFSPVHPFKLPLYRGKPYPPEHFDRVGIVTLGCNIHDWMVGYIYVSETPFFAKTGAAGTAAIDDLPPGDYTLRVWHPSMEQGEDASVRHLTLNADGPTSVEWELNLKPIFRVPRVPTPGAAFY